MADAITVKNILDAEVGPSRKLSDDHITPRKSLRRSSSAARCDWCRFPLGSERLLGLAALPIGNATVRREPIAAPPELRSERAPRRNRWPSIGGLFPPSSFSTYRRTLAQEVPDETHRSCRVRNAGHGLSRHSQRRTCGCSQSVRLEAAGR